MRARWKARKNKADDNEYEKHPYLNLQKFLTKKFSKPPKKVVKRKKAVKKRHVSASLQIQTGRKLDLS